MLRHVDLHDFLLVGKLGALVPLDAVGRRHVFLKTGILIGGEQVEHAHLAGVAILLALRGVLKQRRFLQEVHELLARVSRRVEGTALDERFKRLTVEAFRIDAVHEVVQAGERAVLLTLGNDGIGHVTPNAAHADEPEADAVLDRGELGVRRIDVRRQHGRAVVVAARDVADEAVGVAHVARQHCGHVLVRVMRLQVRRAHDQDGVCSRVRLVERVLSELLRIIPNLLRDVE